MPVVGTTSVGCRCHGCHGRCHRTPAQEDVRSIPHQSSPDHPGEYGDTDRCGDHEHRNDTWDPSLSQLLTFSWLGCCYYLLRTPARERFGGYLILGGSRVVHPNWECTACFGTKDYHYLPLKSSKIISTSLIGFK